jgi:hypothetical protein
MGYIETTLPELTLPNIFYDECLEYSNNYHNQHSVYPSAKAVSSASKTNNLLLYSEQEVNFLLQNRLQNSVLKNTPIKPVVDMINIEIKEENSNKIIEQSEERNNILNKHCLSIISSSDIQLLSKEDRAEIKSVFRSEFYFLKVLKEYRN